MSDTMSDERYYTYLDGDGTESTTDLLNTKLSGALQTDGGYGSAIVESWGNAGDTVIEAELRHYTATAGETIQDARFRYYGSAV